MSKITRIHPEFEGSNNAADLAANANFSVQVNVKDGEWNFSVLKGKMTRYEFIGMLQCIISDMTNRVNKGEK